MSQVPDGVDRTELFIVAREVLLDGLTVLSAQSEALTVVGAQAVYLRTEDRNVDLTIPVFTSDADLGIDPAYLHENPRIHEVLQEANFELTKGSNGGMMPGQWFTSKKIGDRVVNIAMDLLVPKTVSGTGSNRRRVNLPPQDQYFARGVVGLEAAMVDADMMDVASLRPPSADQPQRVLSARVAGPAALFVAKAHKIAERERNAEAGQPDRLTDKDAGDVVRLMLGTEPDEVAARFAILLGDERTAESTAKGLDHLHKLFGSARATGTRMAMSALAGDPIEEEVPGIVGAYMADLPTAEL